jgi:hypothetical protein
VLSSAGPPPQQRRALEAEVGRRGAARRAGHDTTSGAVALDDLRVARSDERGTFTEALNGG